MSIKLYPCDSFKYLLEIDPYSESLSKNLHVTDKRGGCKKVLSWIIHILTFGRRALNPDLDIATQKIIQIANASLNFPPAVITQMEQDDLLAAFNNLRIVVLKNQGSRCDAVEEMIHKIRNIANGEFKDSISQNLAAYGDSVEYSPPHSQLLEILRKYKEESFNSYKDYYRIKRLEKEVLALLPEVKFFRSKYDEDLCRILLDADAPLFSDAFPKLQPEFIETIVRLSLNRRLTFFWRRKGLLEKFANELLKLPNDHPNLYAFLKALPLAQDLPISFDYYKMTTKCRDIAEFLVSDIFNNLINHVKESERLFLFQNLPSYAGRALEMPRMDYQQQILNRDLFELPKRFIKYRELILLGLFKSKDFFKIINYHFVDKKLILNVCAQDLERCYDAFLKCPDNFDHSLGRAIVAMLFDEDNGFNKDKIRGLGLHSFNDILGFLADMLSREVSELAKQNWPQAMDHFSNAHSRLKKLVFDRYKNYLIEELNSYPLFSCRPRVRYVAWACHKETPNTLYNAFKERGHEAGFLKAISKFPNGFLKDVCTPFGFYLEDGVTQPEIMSKILLKIDPVLKDCFEEDGSIKPAQAVKIDWLYGRLSTQALITALAGKEIKPLFLFSLLNDHETSDITIIAEGKEIKAHKCILAGAYYYFHYLFKYDQDSSSTIISEISYSEMFAVVKAAYYLGNFVPFDDDESSFRELIAYFTAGKQRLGN